MKRKLEDKSAERESLIKSTTEKIEVLLNELTTVAKEREKFAAEERRVAQQNRELEDKILRIKAKKTNLKAEIESLKQKLNCTKDELFETNFNLKQVQTNQIIEEEIRVKSQKKTSALSDIKGLINTYKNFKK